ncbi:MAG: hypothetical protein CL843_16330 [Crocinitomicaceae bacterium]|nr:hypothetical protein [Crocinitomicaceae bacterium]|tara:strand:+ start:258 stop:566 length:309 start_codon:yes stop_codon:yes gene_type:complete
MKVKHKLKRDEVSYLIHVLHDVVPESNNELIIVSVIKKIRLSLLKKLLTDSKSFKLELDDTQAVAFNLFIDNYALNYNSYTENLIRTIYNANDQFLTNFKLS